ncbi:hypothetical protein ACLI1A_08690 [Flavobacterium sp. RHBU_3]|uniref:hypothetical protein n=1 Tax=Flavobacterium sp. RHBU_3 TaxID=3391184 RepID=UPI003984AE8F
MEANDKRVRTPEDRAQRLEEIRHLTPDTTLPYEDPAVVNPEELASFPRPAKKVGSVQLEEESEMHLVSVKHSAVREGKNIVRTDTGA